MAKTEVSAPEELFKELENKLLGYYPDINIPLVRKAYEFAAEKHIKQTRSSGEPYITHPLGVAIILAEMRLDSDSVITAILHDTVEDTSATFEEIEQNFGASIAALVDGVTKISRISFKTNEEKQAENFRKMIVAMARDIRVILVKLADRTHNMRTLEHLNERKRRTIARETLDIYAPLANRLGISWMKAELEDLCLRYLKPEIYYRLAAQVAKKKSEREKYIQDVQEVIEEQLQEYAIKASVFGRAKHFYSIYKKMETRNLDFEQIHDILAFRIILDNITECYKALGVIHSAFKPVPGRFKDYVAMPKPNNYQSLHTTVIGPYGERVEIQIRTQEMHEVAMYGIAAHWKYKEGRADSKDASRMDWLNRLMDTHRNLQDPTEFLESVKIDLYQGDVYVFTPKGEVKEFPAGATPLDFAFSVHTDLGLKTVGAKVNGQIVPLKYRLRSGDTIEILTSTHQRPSKDWLKIVRSSKAKAKIRSFIKQQEREKAKELGKEILDRELRRFQSNVQKITKSGDLERGLKEMKITNIDELYIYIGYGKVMAKDAVKKVLPQEDHESAEEIETNYVQGILSKVSNRPSAKTAVLVDGMEDVLIRFARCCSPIPGDSIVGFVTRGRGVTVHRRSCPRAMEVGDERRLEVTWNMSEDKKLNIRRQVKIRVQCEDTPGILATMTQTISGLGVNISQATVRTLKDGHAVCLFEVSVSSVEELVRVISAIESKPGIISVERCKEF